jgi:predicted HicB family RNase H-like nuclease
MQRTRRIQRSIRLAPEVDAALRALAAEQGASISHLIERACRTAYLAPPKAKRGQKGK